MCPRALVPRFLLHPHDVARGGVAREDVAHGGEGERAELLDAHERDAGVETARGALFDEVVVELAGEERDALDSGGGDGRRGVVEDGVELAPRGELAERRGGRLSDELVSKDTGKYDRAA